MGSNEICIKITHLPVFTQRLYRDYSSSLFYSNTMFAYMCVCLRPISSGMAGPIWLNFFLLAPSWSRDGFRPKKFRIRDPDFPKIRKNRFWREIIKYFCKNLRIFMWKMAEMIVLCDFTNSVTYYLLRRKGRATFKSVEGAQLPKATENRCNL